MGYYFRSRGSRRFNNRSFGNKRGSFVGDKPSSKYINKPTSEEKTEPAYVATHKFSDFQINDKLKKNIADHGYLTPTPIQDQVIPYLLEGRDVVGIANTGTGKTAAFLIPVLDKLVKDPRQNVLIVAPTRELAFQIQDEVKEFSKGLDIFVALCIGGASIGGQVSTLRRNPNVVIGTPGRLIDLTSKALDLRNFETIVLDEVDRMVDIGFIKDIRYLVSLLPQERQSLFFSATITPDISGIMHAFLKDPITISVKKEETVNNIEQDVIYAYSQQEKINKLNALLKQEEFKKVIIFGRTKWSVERLSQTLQRNGFQAISIHGNKNQNQRLRALEEFKRDRLQVLVATDVAARGLDIEDVTHVINYDEPTNYTDYIHRIGRTGRANKRGKALTFIGS